MTAALAAPPERQALACARCGQPFARPEHLALHLGRAHEQLAPDERAAFEAALADEEAALAKVRTHARALLKTTPFLALALTMLVFMLAGGVNPGFVFMAVPVLGVLFAVVYLVALATGED